MDVPDLNDIRIFTVVGQQGTLTSAAGKLRLPTSTVSRALTRLEKSLDVLLIRRSSRGLHPHRFRQRVFAGLQKSAAHPV